MDALLDLVLVLSLAGLLATLLGYGFYSVYLAGLAVVRWWQRRTFARRRWPAERVP